MSLERKLIEVPTEKCWYWWDNPRLAYVGGEEFKGNKLRVLETSAIPLVTGLQDGGVIINPLHARLIPPREEKSESRWKVPVFKYQIFIGNRRLAAARRAQLPTLPILFYPNITESEMWELAVQESAVFETKGWSPTGKEFGMAQVMKRSRGGWVAP